MCGAYALTVREQGTRSASLSAEMGFTHGWLNSLQRERRAHYGPVHVCLSRVFKQQREPRSLLEHIVASLASGHIATRTLHVTVASDITERRGRVINTLASYSGGPRFNYRPGGQLS
jgi:hypothetical protein